MGRTLLVSDRRWSWRDWTREHLAGRDLVVLDPSCTDFGPATRLLLVRVGKVAEWAHIGSPDPLHDPVALVAGASRLLALAGDDALVQLFPWRWSPLGRHIALQLAQTCGLDSVLVPVGSGLENQPWPVGAEAVELTESFPPMVQEAQRRAQWIDLLEKAERHGVDLASASLVGSRLGSGVPVAIGMEGAYAEACGGTLLMVTDTPLGDAEVARAMDLAHAHRSQVVSPSAYVGLVCSLAHQDGSDFGLGVVDSLDFGRKVAHIRALAVAPAPVRILKLGTVRIDAVGKEIEDLKPWAV
ncbi:MAG: hypothetical protein JSS65_01475 [Armatimonadetes bacterium]|nr:hypothetical protein [Armatimonadota bacterium]